MEGVSLSVFGGSGLLVALGWIPQVSGGISVSGGDRSSPAGPQPVIGIRFVERDDVGMQPLYPKPGHGTALAACDVDEDGDVDFFAPNDVGYPDQYYRNDGTGHFDELAAAAGLDSLVESRGALWFDYNGDNRPDLIRTNDANPTDSSFILHRQEPNGTFVDVTIPAGLKLKVIGGENFHRGGSAAGDLNNDGWLDFYSGMWRGHPTLFMNDGTGTFTDTTVAAGVYRDDHQWQCMLWDADQDGWTDIYVALDFEPNRMWMNQTDGTFVDKAPDYGVDIVMNDMGMSILDYDDDGDFDLYTTNVYGADPKTFVPEYNAMLRNDSVEGNLSFTDVSESIGVDNGSWGWGVTAIDADRDGLVDIAATNGYTGLADRSRFFWQDPRRPGDFVEIGKQVDIQDHLWGSALISADFDRDGDLDLAQTCVEGVLRVLTSEPHPDYAGVANNYLVIKPRMAGNNRRAIGAVVKVTVGQRTMMRLISAGTSFLGQEPAEAHFGLGQATVADRIEVHFPGGAVVERRAVPANQVLRVDAP